jgi:murein DD-endopeptidase MepM/ murein hydrolase activator NlpD
LNLSGSRPHLKPDGIFGDDTDRSVRYFQSTHALSVDGVVGHDTVDALERRSKSKTTIEATTPPTSTTGSGDFCFPLAHRPSPDWKGGARYFGAPRDGGRLHAGCDLLAPQGTTVYAVADGVLRNGGEYTFTTKGKWSAMTHAVEIRHGNLIARYGEILPGSYVGGAHVKRGQAIAKIGGLKMLHFELYTNGSDPGSLTGSNAYHRRRDVTNPSPYLDKWVNNLPGQ